MFGQTHFQTSIFKYNYVASFLGNLNAKYVPINRVYLGIHFMLSKSLVKASATTD